MTDLKKSLPALLIPRLWPVDRPDLRRRVVIAFGFLLLAKLVNVAVPYFFKQAVDLLDRGINANQLAIGTGVIGSVLGMVLAYGIARMLAQGFGELRDAVFAKVAQAATRVAPGQSVMMEASRRRIGSSSSTRTIRNGSAVLRSPAMPPLLPACPRGEL